MNSDSGKQSKREKSLKELDAELAAKIRKGREKKMIVLHEGIINIELLKNGISQIKSS